MDFNFCTNVESFANPVLFIPYVLLEYISGGVKFTSLLSMVSTTVTRKTFLQHGNYGQTWACY